MDVANLQLHTLATAMTSFNIFSFECLGIKHCIMLFIKLKKLLSKNYVFFPPKSFEKIVLLGCQDPAH